MPEELIMNEVDRTIDQANKIKRVGTIGCIVLAGVFFFVAIFAAFIDFSGAADDRREAAATPTTSKLSESATPEDDLDSAPQPTCVDLTRSEIEAITEGAEDPDSKIISHGSRLSLANDHGSFKQVVAVKLGGPMQKGYVATFAIGDQVGPVIALNKIAFENFTWGDAINPDSPMAEERSLILQSAEHDQAIKCIG
jgi:hypothetical protein